MMHSLYQILSCCAFPLIDIIITINLFLFAIQINPLDNLVYSSITARINIGIRAYQLDLLIRVIPPGPYRQNGEEINNGGNT